jgi:hypothetical protein
MHPKKLQDLVASAAGRRLHSEAAINSYLNSEGIFDPASRIAAKLEIAAQAGELATDQTHIPRGSLASDLAPSIGPRWRRSTGRWPDGWSERGST